jgi:pimeloyl-ACP methyl ester carboxylesterase
MSFTKQIIACALFATAFADVIDPDEFKTFSEIATENGFRFEEHTVTTEDGYILTVFRVPGLINEPVQRTKPVVFMQHGLMDSANAWVMNWPEVAPAFVTARAGYDVWLGNSRGNTYSRAHVSLNPDSKLNHKFWEFDFEEMGQYDIPAYLEYITALTGNEKVSYIGHSQGTTQMFYGASELADYYSSRLNLFVALGPVTKITGDTGYMYNIAQHYDEIDDYTKMYGYYEIMPYDWKYAPFWRAYCTAFEWVCEMIEYDFISHNPLADDQDRFRVYMGHEPNGASMQSLLLFAQNMRMDRFQKWCPLFNCPTCIGDKHRISDEIPLGDIKVPTAIIVAREDTVATPIDAEWTASQIGPSVVHFQEIAGGHVTYIIGKDMSYFTNDVMGLLATYNPSEFNQPTFL